MKKVYEIIFSPTGHSKKAAELIAGELITGELRGQKKTVDLCLPGDEERETAIEAGSICIFSVPCYGGRVPQTAAERISKRIKAPQGKEKVPAIICVTYGNRAFEDALLELADLVEKAGFRVAAAAALVAEHNIVHEFAAGRPDEKDEQEIRAFAAKARQFLNEGAESGLKKGAESDLAIPGNRPYKTWKASAPDIIVDKSTCVYCGMCALKCPTAAISKDGQRVDRGKCIGCMRCLAICRSRSLPPAYVSGLREKIAPACQGRKENLFFLPSDACK